MLVGVLLLAVVVAAIVVPRAMLTSRLPEPAAKVEPGVVDVMSVLGLQNAEAAGTGIVISSSGEVLTNNHVVEGATGVEVTDVGNGHTYKATVVGTDAAADVALLQLHGASGLRTVSFGNSSRVVLDQAVVAIGNAGGTGGKPTVTTGVVTALDQSIVAVDFTGQTERLSGLIQTDVPLQPGDSGGPLVNNAGRVIGVNTAASNGYSFQGAAKHQGYAVPSNTATAVARQIEAGRASASVHIGPSGFLGVEVENPATGSGALVIAVFKGSPARRAGLLAGDVISSIGGQPITSVSGLTAAMRQFHPHQTVEVGWVDPQGVQHVRTVSLATGPAD